MIHLIENFIPQDFWHGTKQLGKNFSPGTLSGYYSNLTHKTVPYHGKKSYEGVPLVYLGKNLGYLLHPVTVCQVALGWHERWLEEKSENAYQQFITLSNWLIENQVQDPLLGGIWPVPYSIPFYNLNTEWVSALVQGQAISTLARAYEITKNEVYFSAMKSATVSFLKPIEVGGINRTLDTGDVFFEEYPSDQQNIVLNGWISSLWGIFDYLLVDKDHNLRELYECGLESLNNYLERFDSGFWSNYSLFKKFGFVNLASPYYHEEHITQLNAMYLLTNKSTFKETADRWKEYRNNKINLSRVLISKSYSRIVVRIINKLQQIGKK